MDEAWQAGAPDSASDPNVLLEEVKGVSDSPSASIVVGTM